MVVGLTRAPAPSAGKSLKGICKLQYIYKYIPASYFGKMSFLLLQSADKSSPMDKNTSFCKIKNNKLMRYKWGQGF